MSIGLESGIVPGQGEEEQQRRNTLGAGLIKGINNSRASKRNSYNSNNNYRTLSEGARGVTDFQLEEDYSEDGRAFDPSIYANNQDLENVLYDEASGAMNLGKGVVNFAGKTMLETAGNLGGAVYGAVAAISAGDFSKFYDNDFTNFITDSEESLRGFTRVYSDEETKNGGFLTKLTHSPTVFANDALDSLAFTAGMILSEAALGGIASIGIYSKMAKAVSPILRNSAKGMNAAKKGKAFVDGVDKVARKKAWGEGLGLTRRTFINGAVWEGIVETKGSMSELTQQLQDKGFSKDEIDKRVAAAEKYSLGANVAVTGFSNMIQFPRVFKTPKFLKISKRWANKSMPIAAKRKIGGAATGSLIRKSGKDKLRIVNPWMKGMLKAGHLVKNPLSEGAEEFTQGVISNSLINTYGKGYDGEEVTFLNAMNEVGNAMTHGLTTDEGRYEIGMGIMMGLLGAPGIGTHSAGSKKNNDKKGKLKATWNGGIWGEAKDFDRKVKLYEEQIEAVNNGKIFDGAKNIAGGIYAAQKAGEMKDGAAKEGKFHAAENYYDDEFYSNNMPFFENGFGELAKSRMGMTEDMSDEEWADSFFDAEQAEELKSKPEQIKKLRTSFQESINNKFALIENSNTVLNRSNMSDPAMKKMAKYYYYKAKSSLANNDQLKKDINEILDVDGREAAKDAFNEMEEKYSVLVADEKSPSFSDNEQKAAFGLTESKRLELKDAIKNLSETMSIEDKDERTKALGKSFNEVASLGGKEAAVQVMMNSMDSSKTEEEKLAKMASIRDMYEYQLLDSEQAVLDKISDTNFEDKDSLRDYFKAIRSNELMAKRATDLFNNHFTNEKDLVKQRNHEAYDDLFNALSPEYLNQIDSVEELEKYKKDIQKMKDEIDPEIFAEREKESVLQGSDAESIKARQAMLVHKHEKTAADIEKRFQDKLDKEVEKLDKKLKKIDKDYPIKDKSDFTENEVATTEEDTSNNEWNKEVDALIAKRASITNQGVVLNEFTEAMGITIDRTEQGLPVRIGALQDAINYLYSEYKRINTLNKGDRVANGLTEEQVNEVSKSLENSLNYLSEALNELKVNNTLTLEEYEETKSEEQDKLIAIDEKRSKRDSKRDKEKSRKEKLNKDLLAESKLRAYIRRKNKLISDAYREFNRNAKAINSEYSHLIDELSDKILKLSKPKLDPVTYSDRMIEFENNFKDKLEVIKRNEKLLQNAKNNESPLDKKDEGSNNNPDKAEGLGYRFVAPDIDPVTNNDSNNDGDKDKRDSFDIALITDYRDDPSYHKNIVDFINEISDDNDLSEKNNVSAKIEIVKLGDDLDPRNGSVMIPGDFTDDAGVAPTGERFAAIIDDEIDGKPVYGFKVTLTDASGEHSLVTSMWSTKSKASKQRNAVIAKAYQSIKNEESDMSITSKDVYLAEKIKPVTKEDGGYKDTNLASTISVNGVKFSDLSEDDQFAFWTKFMGEPMLSVTNRSGNYMHMSTEEGEHKWVPTSKMNRTSRVKGKLFLLGDGLFKRGKGKNQTKPFKLNTTPIKNIPGASELSAQMIVHMMSGRRFDTAAVKEMHDLYISVTGDTSLEPSNDMQKIFNAILYNGNLNEKAAKSYGVLMQTGAEDKVKIFYFNGVKYISDGNGSLLNSKTKALIALNESNILTMLESYPNLRINVDVKRLVESSVGNGTYMNTVLGKYLSTESGKPMNFRIVDDKLTLDYEENDMITVVAMTRFKSSATSSNASGKKPAGGNFGNQFGDAGVSLDDDPTSESKKSPKKSPKKDTVDDNKQPPSDQPEGSLPGGVEGPTFADNNSNEPNIESGPSEDDNTLTKEEGAAKLEDLLGLGDGNNIESESEDNPIEEVSVSDDGTADKKYTEVMDILKSGSGDMVSQIQSALNGAKSKEYVSMNNTMSINGEEFSIPAILVHKLKSGDKSGEEVLGDLIKEC